MIEPASPRTKRKARLLAGAIAVFIVLTGGCATRAAKAPFIPSDRILKWAEEGETEAQCKIGWIYFGRGDYELAAKWLARAADNGNINSTGAAARLFIEGLGVPKDVERGIRYLRLGAEFPGGGGNENCAKDLAEIYEEGKLVRRDYAEAYYYFGVALAQCGGEREWRERRQLVRRRTVLGKQLTAETRTIQDYRLFQWVDHLKSFGCEWLSYVVVDPSETAKWFQASAEKGNHFAQAELARIHVEGRGVPADVVKGVGELRRLATMTDANLDGPCSHASIYLADLYAKGRLVSRNDAEAYYYYGLGIIGGYDVEDLVARRRAVGNRLTREERQAQNNRLRSWIIERKANGYHVFGESEFVLNEN